MRLHVLAEVSTSRACAATHLNALPHVVRLSHAPHALGTVTSRAYHAPHVLAPFHVLPRQPYGDVTLPRQHPNLLTESLTLTKPLIVVFDQSQNFSTGPVLLSFSHRL